MKSLDKAAQLAMLPDCPIHTVDLTVGTVFPYSIAYWVILVILCSIVLYYVISQLKILYYIILGNTVCIPYYLHGLSF